MTRDRILRALVIHANWNNRGDEAAIRAMMDTLRERLPIGSIKIIMKPDKIGEFPYDDIELLPNYPVQMFERIDSYLTVLLFGKWSFTTKGRKFAKAVDEADIVIHAPGGASIGDTYGNFFSRLDHLYRIFFVQTLKGKPFFFYAPSMGPFDDKLMNIARRIVLRRVRSIVLREHISAEFLKNQLGIDSITTLDAAYQNSVSPDYLNKYPELSPILDTLRRKKVIGMTVTDFKWHPQLKKLPKLGEEAISSISEFIEYLLDKGVSILLIPQTFHDSSDVELLDRLSAMNHNNVVILPPRVDAYGQQVVISGLHCLVGMRYHSNIFASKAAVPFIPICYEHKMTGFVDMIGLKELSIDIHELSVEELKSKYEHLERHYQEYVELLRMKNPKLVRESGSTNEILAKILRAGEHG